MGGFECAWTDCRNSFFRAAALGFVIVALQVSGGMVACVVCIGFAFPHSFGPDSRSESAVRYDASLPHGTSVCRLQAGRVTDTSDRLLFVRFERTAAIAGVSRRLTSKTTHRTASVTGVSTIGIAGISPSS